MVNLFHIDTPDEYARQRGQALVFVYLLLIGVCVAYIPYILFVSEGLEAPMASIGLTACAMGCFGFATRLAKSARVDASIFFSSVLIICVILAVHAIERTMRPVTWLVLPAVMLTCFARRPRNVAWFTIPLLSMFALLVWLLRDHVVAVKLYDEYARLGAVSVAALAMSYMMVSVHQRIMPALERIRTQEQEATEAAHDLREQAQEERMRLERSRAEKDAFLASMSHELRTPLTGIVGLSTLIEEELEFDDEPAPEEVLRAIQGIQHEANTFLDMCQRALEIAEQDASSSELHPWSLELSGFVQEVYASVRVTMISRGVELTIEDGLTDPLITHDSLWLRRMLRSVLLFVSHRTEEGEVTLALSDSADEVSLESTDRGDPVDMERWAALERSPDASIDELPYAYRELLLVQRLAGAMGGAMQISQAEGSTSVTITLPRDLLTEEERGARLDEAEEQRRLDALLGSSSGADGEAKRSLRERVRAYYNPSHLPLEERIPAGALMRLFTFGALLLIGTLSWRLAALSNEPGHLPVVIVRALLILWTVASVELSRRGRGRLAIGVISIFLLLLTYATTARTMGVSASSNLYVSVVVQLMIIRGAREIVGLTTIVATIALGIHVWHGLHPTPDPMFPYYGYLPGGITYAIVISCVTLLGVICARLNTSELERAKQHIRQLMRARHQEQLGRQRAERARASTSLANQVRARFLTSLSADVDEALRALQEYIGVIDQALSARDDDLFADDIGNLNSATARLRWLVDDVLMFAAIRAERITPEEQEVSLQRVWERASALITERLGHPVTLRGFCEHGSTRGVTDVAHASQLIAQFALMDSELGDPELHLDEISPRGVTFSIRLAPFPEDDPRLKLANSMAGFRSSFLQALQRFLDQGEARLLTSSRVCFVPFHIVER